MSIRLFYYLYTNQFNGYNNCSINILLKVQSNRVTPTKKLIVTNAELMAGHVRSVLTWVAFFAIEEQQKSIIVSF